jgi:CHAD domain-containing protein
MTAALTVLPPPTPVPYPPPTRSVGGIGPQPWLDHLVKHLPVARAGQDPEGVHQVRVACARLLVWLELGGGRLLRDDLRRLRDHASRMRDLDVLRAEDPSASLPEAPGSELATARQELLQALEDPRVDRLILALESMPPLPAARARAAVCTLARTALRRGRGRRLRRGRVKALHRLRRAVRRLRFALEWTGAEVPRIVELQDALGAVCDHAVALRRLEKGADASAAGKRRLVGLERALSRGRRHALRVWREARPTLKALRRPAALRGLLPAGEKRTER